MLSQQVSAQVQVPQTAQTETVKVGFPGAVIAPKPPAPVTPFERLQILDSANRLPALVRGGIVVPQSLLLERLQTAANSDSLQVTALELTTEKARLQMLSSRGIDVRIVVDFVVRSVDWRRRAITLDYTETLQSGSETVIGRALGTIVLAAFADATSDKLMQRSFASTQAISASVPATQSVLGAEAQTITIWLDKIPELEAVLHSGVGSVKIFDYVGIQSVSAEQGGLRVQMGTFF